MEQMPRVCHHTYLLTEYTAIMRLVCLGVYWTVSSVSPIPGTDQHTSSTQCVTLSERVSLSICRILECVDLSLHLFQP